MVFGIIGMVFIQWIVIGKLYSRLDKHSRYLRSDKGVLKSLHNKIIDITKYGNGSLQEAFRRIDENAAESEYLDGKIELLLDLLNQEYEESVK